jgi:hypothetical protein
MKTLCLTILIIVLTVSTDGGEVVKTESKLYIPKIRIKEELFPVYDSGRLIHYSTAEYIGSAKVLTDYRDVLRRMLDSACADGVTIRINSGYRTIDEQFRIRRRYVRNKICAEDTTYLFNAPSSAFYPETGRPGHSRHHAGIAYDFNTKDPRVYIWLQRNAIRFGFVRTIAQERWHWEYHPHICDPYHYVKKGHWSWRISKKAHNDKDRSAQRNEFQGGSE